VKRPALSAASDGQRISFRRRFACLAIGVVVLVTGVPAVRPVNAAPTPDPTCSTKAKPKPDSIYTGGNARVLDADWQQYAVLTNDRRFRLRLANGTLSRASFASIERYSEAAFHVVDGTCHGAIDRQGRVLIPIAYSDVRPVFSRTPATRPGTPTLIKAGRNDGDTIFVLDNARGRVVQRRTLDARFAEQVPVGRYMYVRIQASDGGYGLLDANLSTILSDQFSIELVGLGHGGLSPYMWLAATERNVTLLDDSGRRLDVTATKAKQVWLPATVPQGYLALLNAVSGECRYVTRRGLQSVVVYRTEYTDSGCPEFRDFVVPVPGSAVAKAPSTWRILKLVKWSIVTTATFPNTVDVFDLGRPNGAIVTAPHEFRVVDASGAVRVVDETGALLRTATQ
jgi:hypothetical protein